MSIPKALVFDVSGVITDDDLPSQVEAFAAEHGIPFSAAWEAVDTMNYPQACVGKKTPEEMHRTTLQKLGIGASYDEFVAMHRRAYAVRPGMISFVRSLQGKARLFVLSNQTPVMAPSLHALLDPLFEAVFFSNEVGMKKPDHPFFRALLDEVQLRPEECVFIDDNVGNINAAWELGMRTVLFRGKESLRKELEILGISI